MLWIGLSDRSLAISGGLTAWGALVSMSKGAAFVLLSSVLVYWLCTREYRESARIMRLLRAVIEGTSDSIYAKDKDGRYLLVNATAQGLMGQPASEILGRSDLELIAPSEAQRIIANDQVVMAGKQAITIEETLTTQGITHEYQSTKAPFFDERGEVAGLIGISRNITDRKQIDAALRETDARLREAQRIAKLGSWSWEPSTDRVWWSDAEFELMGVSPQQTQPGLKTFLSLLHPDDRAIAVARVEAMLAGANAFADDLRIIRADGSLMWIHSQARATRDADGNIIRVEGTDQDITAERLARDAALESERRLQAAVEVAGLGVTIIDYASGLAELSPQAAEQFGFFPRTQATREELHAIFHPHDRELLDKLIERMLDPQGNGCMAVEHRVVHSDKTIRWLNVRKQVTFKENRPHRAILVSVDITEQKNAEARLREQEMLVREASELAKVGGWGFDPVTLRSDWTPEVARIYGFPPDEPPPMDKALDFFSPEQRPALEAALTAAMQDGEPHDMELQLTAWDGERKWVRTICRPIVEGGRVVRVRGSLQDITDRKREESERERDLTARRQLEEQFRQAQKMEAVGRLAGGVAHDFNNLLTVINGYSELVLAELPDENPLRGPLTAIHDAGERAARLTEQLLTFSRKSMVKESLVDLNELVTESAKLYRRLIGEDVTLTVTIAPTPVRVVVDPGQMEQVLMNLAVNARDAMPQGGKLTIETGLIKLDAHDDRPHGLAPGSYASLRVADTGCGISEEFREKIFEPFFTTKGVGKGTGLGLAVVHGIIQQAGGTVLVESTVGSGTSFHIMLPAVTEAPDESVAAETMVAPRGDETVLVAEDEDTVRTLVRVVLEAQGYHVLTASNGNDARSILQTYTGRVDLLITDVIMPETSGKELANLARTTVPDLPVLYMSGYTDDALDRHGLQGSADQFIQKPFTPLGLARIVREILDQ